MDVELSEIRDFLAAHAPFDELPRAELDALPRRLAVAYFRRGTKIMAFGQDNHHLYVLRSGAVDIHDRHGMLVDRGETGTCFGSTTLVTGNPSTFDVTAIEDSLTLVLPGEVFHELARRHPDFDAFFDDQRAARMSGAVATIHTSASGAAILKTRVRDLLGRDPVTVGTEATIQEAAAVMRAHGVSSLLVMDSDTLAGIVTDRDLRNRVLAVGRSPLEPVTAIMSADPVTGSAQSLAFEVLLEMTGRNIHHLPIIEHGTPVGIVTTTDLMRLEQANPVYLVGDIAKQPDVPGIASISARLPSVVRTLVDQDASADEISRIVTVVGDAIDRRVLTLAEAQLGPAPIPYCWVTLGSRARQEQALSADQDHALILDKAAGPEHEAYFAALAQRVVDGLVECGYPRCPGEVMATNPKLRVSLGRWRSAFTTWLTEPVPEAILRASIFFDMRPVHGDARLFRKLQRHVLKTAPTAHRFLAHLTKRAVENEPPLGFFRGFVVEKAGEHKDAVDIKRGGIGAVVELTRVLALSIGSEAVNTQDRLRAVVDAGVLSPGTGQDLRDAFEFISYVRLRHQVAQVRAGRAPDNFVEPASLSTFDKRHLREAFGIVRAAQTALVHRYPTTYIS